MFGLNDPGVALAFSLTFASTALCVVYGIINWNKGDDAQEEDPVAEQQWEKNEKDLEESL